MHIRGASLATEWLGQHARTFAHGAGMALDTAVGAAHHYGNNIDPRVEACCNTRFGFTLPYCHECKSLAAAMHCKRTHSQTAISHVDRM